MTARIAIAAPAPDRRASRLLLAVEAAFSGTAGRWLLRTLGIVVPVFFLASFLTYSLGAISGVTPAGELLGDGATPEMVHDLNVKWGLDRPLPAQYAVWLVHALKGNLGQSWYSNLDVSGLIAEKAPVTLSVAVLALAIGVTCGFLLGCIAAITTGSWFDRLLTLALSIATSVPAFVVGVMLIAVCSVWFPAFPTAGYIPMKFGFLPWLSTILLPAMALSLDTTADLARQLRSAIVATNSRNFVLGARARGYSEARIFFRHVLPNSLGPPLAILGMKFPALLGGAVVTETVFNMNGYGKFAADSALRGDVPAVQAVLLVSVSLVLIFSILVNLLQLRLNPASRRGF